jgi:DNA-binding NtrC family response regulator
MKNFFYHSVILKGLDNRPGTLPSLDKLKKEYIAYLLKVTGNNKTKTAEILNISIPGLYNKINRYGLNH